MQIYVALRTQIESAELNSGDKLPPEHELAAAHGVSRITIRSALGKLVQDGLIERRAGAGTIVRAAVHDERSCLLSLTEQMISAGRVPKTQLIGLSLLLPNDPVGARLPFKAGAQVARIERLRLVDSTPLVLSSAYIPYEQVQGIGPEHFAESGIEQSLIYVLEQKFGLVLDKGQESIGAVPLGEVQAAFLRVPTGTPAILHCCTVNDIRGTPLLYDEAVWAAERINQVQRRRGFTVRGREP